MLDFGQASVVLDQLVERAGTLVLDNANEAQTRYDIIDRMLREVLQWTHGSVSVEEHTEGPRAGYVDYLLRHGDDAIVVEAKRIGSAFPAPTRAPQLKLSGSVLRGSAIAGAIKQARDYARSKGATMVVVTNGRCWCFMLTDTAEDGYSALAFPLDDAEDANRLFDILSVSSVSNGSLVRFSAAPVRVEPRLLAVVSDADDRLHRNRVAEHIIPAMNAALYADALVGDIDSLTRCFVTTEARTRFDAQLGVQLTDPKPSAIGTAERIRTGKRGGAIERIVTAVPPDHAPPVTLVIGPVGAGKSTYLQHFRLVSARDILQKAEALWVYIDFEKMGPGANPRSYLYRELQSHLGTIEPLGGSFFNKVVEPAYKQDFDAWARGPLAMVFADKSEFRRRATDYIQRDFDQVEPYVDKVFGYLARKQLCVIVLDNVDLYEDDDLEKKVLGEGLALSKRLRAHVILSIRDSTFVRHKADSVFDAYQLRRLWLDPPAFDAVLSARLAYAKKILSGQEATIGLPNDMRLRVPDLSVFFEVVQSSILAGPAGQFIVDMADLNVRRGLTMVTNFLLSGHIQADRVLQGYIEDSIDYRFPFHEVFKGAVLGQWKHFSEARAECINLYDARLASRRLLLLRLHALRLLLLRLEGDGDAEMPVGEIHESLRTTGASVEHILHVLRDLQRAGLVRTSGTEDVRVGSAVSITRSGTYHERVLVSRFVYVDECLLDTAIHSSGHWERLSNLTRDIEEEVRPVQRTQLRGERVDAFMTYLSEVESDALDNAGADLLAIPRIRLATLSDAARAYESAVRNYEAW